ncbi:glycosyltransferase family 2 protein [Rhodobacteraceae bacterium NNCM2]|nr:glycosyltransferase family 2 protein [Coraliihabitans acroporae]
MSQRPTVSVIIPSRGRPYLVPEVLDALRYLTYPAFEVILVGEGATIDDYDLSDEMKEAVHYVPCYVENISAARNIGIRAARGEIVAFLDDDSVPEPDWLDRLVEPFLDPKVGMAGGRVRDRDGVRLQFDGAFCDLMGEEAPLGHDSAAPMTAAMAGGKILALMGTNSAFRRRGLMATGGFDESYVYYLDETDALIRMALAGWHAAWVPEAEVHHHSDQNGTRGRNRDLRDPYQLGASKSCFGLRHTPPEDRAGSLSRYRAKLAGDLDHQIRLGRISGAERDYMLSRFDLGAEEGLTREAVLPLIADGLERVILPFSERLPRGRLSIAVIGGRGVSAALKTDRIARSLVARGHKVTLLRQRTGMPQLSVKFIDGMWIHEGGAGRGDSGSVLRVFASRDGFPEIARVQPRRDFDAILRPYGWDRMFDRMEWHRVALDKEDVKVSFHVLKQELRESETARSMIEKEISAAIRRDCAIASALPLFTMPPSDRRSATVSPG